MAESIDFSKMPWHPAAEAFPMLPEKKTKTIPFSLAELKESIEQNGLQKPIEWWEDPDTGKRYKIDGRNRERACILADVKPRYKQVHLKEDQSIVKYIDVENGERRHLTPSQKAMAATNLLPIYEAEAKERIRQAQRNKSGKSAPVPITPKKSVDRAAEDTKVSARNIAEAKKIKAEAPDLAEKVMSGEMRINKAKKELEKRKAEASLVEAVSKIGPPKEKETWEVVANEAIEELSGKQPEHADLIILDPPANNGTDYGEGKKSDQRPLDEYLAWISQVVSLCSTFLAKAGALVFFAPDALAHHIAVLLEEEAKLHRRAWIKWQSWPVGSGPEGRNFNKCSRHIFYCTKDLKKFTFHEDALRSMVATPYADVWLNINELRDGDEERLPQVPNQLPLAAVRPLVECLSNPGDLVFDPFMGSGTVGEACVRTGRQFMGCDKNPRFVELARLRLQKASSEIIKAGVKAGVIGKDDSDAAGLEDKEDAPTSNGKAPEVEPKKPAKSKKKSKVEPESVAATA